MKNWDRSESEVSVYIRELSGSWEDVMDTASTILTGIRRCFRSAFVIGPTVLGSGLM